MTNRRPWRMDAAAFSLLAAGLVVSLAIFSLDPADRPGAVYPPLESPRNLLGSAGAWLALALTDALGEAVYVLLASWFVLVVLLFLRRSWLRWSLRLLGWLLLIPCAAVLAELIGVNTTNGPPAGPGGSLGAWLALWLEAKLLPVGCAAALVVSIALGLFLAFDRALVRLLVAIGRVVHIFGRLPFRVLTYLRQRPRTTNPSTARPKLQPEVANVPAETAVEKIEAGSRTIPIHHHAALQLADPAVLSERQRFADFELPPLTLLEDSPPVSYNARDQQLRDRAALLEKTFADFGLHVRVVGINTGPVITQFEVALETGLRVHKVTRLTDDIALNLSVPSVRIIAPIPGKNTVGIEIPNENRANVRLKEVIDRQAGEIQSAALPG